jgi:hypothetical protein
MPSSLSVERRVAITNIAKRPVVLSLNSKETVHLAPGAKSAAIPEHEIANNPDVKKLRERALIDVAIVDAVDPERARGDKAKPIARDK